MKLNKILMVETRSPVAHVYSRFAMPRLGLPILGSIAKRQGYDVRIIIEEIEPLDLHDLNDIDLLCISAITPTVQSAYLLADQARTMGIPVVMGGPHPTYLSEESLLHADWVIRGLAERSFPIFLEALKNNRDLNSIPGLSYKEGEKIIHIDIDPEPLCMDDVPDPDFSLIRGHDGKKFKQGIIPIMTSRGCPHRCRFCSVTPMFGHKMKYSSEEKVAHELNRLRGHGDMIFFYDDNFCASPRRTKKLLNYLMDNEVYLPPWLAQVSVRAARDKELLETMQKAGCHTVFVGFESVNDETLSLYRKRQGVDDIRKAIRRFHEHNIGVHGMFVFGSDAEGIDTIHATAKFAIEEDIESVQFLVLTPLPGTPLFEEFEKDGRLLTRDWSLYDAHHAVFRTKNIAPSVLMDEAFKAMAHVYSPHRTLRRIFQGKWQRAGISLYALRQVKKWQRQNKKLIRAIRNVEKKQNTVGYPIELMPRFDHG